MNTARLQRTETDTRHAERPQQVAVRYGIAIFSVLVALGLGLLLEQLRFRDAALPLLLFAVAISAWFGKTGPGIVAVILASLAFNYYFVAPLYTAFVTTSDVPYFLVFVCFASLITWFSAIRRRIESDLRETRDRLQVEVLERTQQASLLNLTHDTIFVRDMNDVITYWNRGAQELYGWTDEEAIGKNAHDLLKTVFPVPLDEIRAELLRSGRWDGELEKFRSDGTQIAIASRWSLQRTAGDRPSAILETNNDITERKRRERQINALNEELSKRTAELEATNKELEAFAYSISHDLRAPLRHMAGFTQLLQKTAGPTLTEKSQRYVTMILESATKMGNLIDDLLGFSRIGRAEAHKTMVNLDQLVQEAVAEVRQDVGGRNLVWKIGKLPVWYGDRSMLRLALVNLVANAAKFTRTRPQAEIEIGSVEEKGDHLVLFVRDNGVGFNMKYVNKLFGVFQRLHPPEEFEGTGIGLATVQRIAHRHGGRVWAEGAIDQGATFYFSLSKSQRA